MNNHNNPVPFERRSKDRRQRPTTPLSLGSFNGRRKKSRRAEDGENYYVDRYGKRSIFFVFLVLALCLLDGFFTLYFIEHGAREVNPFMQLALNYGKIFFLIIKYVLNGFAIVVLLMHKNFYLFKHKLNVRYLAISLIIAYLILVGYEVYLLNHVIRRT